MTAALQTKELGKRYGRRWGLSDCTLAIPEGKVVGLVGPNGAGKSTLLNLAVGLIRPTSGTVEVLGGRPAESPVQLAKVGFVAQNTPTFDNLTVADHLRFGAWLNPAWDREVANQRISRLGLPLDHVVETLSGGQRAQLALTLAIAKRPKLLILDEPVASLDPLARRDFLSDLNETVLEHGVTVILSSHLVTDLERVCNYVVVLVSSQVQVSGDIEDLMRSHRRITVRGDSVTMPVHARVIEEHHDAGESTFLVQNDLPIVASAFQVDPVTLEDVVLAYMRRSDTAMSGASVSGASS
jgi:ABC-2 type transport system ATP-binding protein